MPIRKYFLREPVKIVVWWEIFFKKPHRRFAGIFLANGCIMHGENHFFGFAYTIKWLESFNTENASEEWQETFLGIKISAKDVDQFFFG